MIYPMIAQMWRQWGDMISMSPVLRGRHVNPMLKIDEQGLQSSAAPNVYVRKIHVSEAPIALSLVDNTIDKTRSTKASSSTPRQMGAQLPSVDEAALLSSGLHVSLDISVVAVKSPNSKKKTWMDNPARPPKYIS